MEGDNTRICPSCGDPVKEGSSFCTKCGAAIPAVAGAAAAAGTPPAPPGPPAATPPGPPGTEAGVPQAPPVPGAPPAAATKRSKAPLIIGIVGGLLVIGGIVVLVLFLTVWSGGGGGAGDTTALAEKYMDAMQKGDAKGYMDCFEPGFFEMGDDPFLEGMDLDIEAILEMTFEFMEVKFSGVALETESETESNARLITTKGKMEMSSMGFTEELDLEDEPLIFDMVKEGGSWYLTVDPMPAMIGPDTGFDDYEDFDFENMDFEDFDFENMDFEDMDFDFEDTEGLDEEEVKSMLNDLKAVA